MTRFPHTRSNHGAPADARGTTARSTARATFVLLAVTVLLAGCTGREEETARGIDEIHRTDGVPVEVRTVEPATFRTYLSFTASLTGAAESTASAMLADEVADVLVSVGDTVRQDAPVVVFPADNPTLNYEQARVGFESARTAYERVRRLYEDDGVSQQTYDDARTQFDLARAQWQTVQDMTQVKAPITGVVTRINVFPSDNVNPGDPLFTVSDYRRLKATVWLNDRQVQEVEVGQTARAVWQDAEITGRVIQVDLAMDQNRKAFAAKLEFDNPDLAVQSGVTASVEIETYRDDASFILNRREIIDDGTTRSVYLAADGQAVRTPVSIARQQGMYVQVASGLLRGQEVITRGIELVGDGTAVRVVGREDLLVQR